MGKILNISCSRIFWVCLSVALVSLPGCLSKNEKNREKAEAPAATLSGIVNDSGVSIYQAAMDGDAGRVSYLLDHGFKPDSADADGRTALAYAAYNGHTAIMKDLLGRGASVNVSDVNGRTALMMAASGPFPQAVKLLLDNHADPDLTDREEHFSALMFAASEGQLEVVRILLTAGANPYLKDIDGDDALAFSVKNNHPEVAAIMRTFMKKNP